ncbi:hypothetical protein GCM10011585_17850 [Edaphobacter dinghuensis]|uniref:Uncharacterized protein n=1 Tax=Edaphobacter dinghuensis TaxID=1560005 RepID=A0A917HD12_9BACT|nr:hypothetical protein GCM10011585_17850 [Edaphobacter dinghuensis]
MIYEINASSDAFFYAQTMTKAMEPPLYDVSSDLGLSCCCTRHRSQLMSSMQIEFIAGPALLDERIGC